MVPESQLLTSGICKHMKRAATHLFKRQSKNRAFFQNCQTYFDLRPPGAKQRSRNPTPGATRMCKSLRVARGRDGQAWN